MCIHGQRAFSDQNAISLVLASVNVFVWAGFLYVSWFIALSLVVVGLVVISV